MKMLANSPSSRRGSACAGMMLRPHCGCRHGRKRCSLASAFGADLRSASSLKGATLALPYLRTLPMTRIEIQVNAVEPFADDRAVGEAGPYLRIRGIAKGELDPDAPEN